MGRFSPKAERAFLSVRSTAWSPDTEHARYTPSNYVAPPLFWGQIFGAEVHVARVGVLILSGVLVLNGGPQDRGVRVPFRSNEFATCRALERMTPPMAGMQWQF